MMNLLKPPKDSIQIVNTTSGYINTYSFKHWLTAHTRQVRVRLHDLKQDLFI